MKYKRLKDARKKQGLSIQHIAKVVGMNPIRYWYLEQHIRHMTIDEFLKAADVLGIEYTLN